MLNKKLTSHKDLNPSLVYRRQPAE